MAWHRATRSGGAARAALLTLTPSRVLLAWAGTTSGATTAHVESVSLGGVSSVSLQYSLLGSWIELTLPGREDLVSRSTTGHGAARHIAFPSPLATPFRALYLRMRALLEVGPALGETAIEAHEEAHEEPHL